MYVSDRLVEILISIFILATTPLVAHIHSFASLGSVHLDTLEALLDGGHFSQFTRLVKLLLGLSSPVAVDFCQFSQGS